MTKEQLVETLRMYDAWFETQHIQAKELTGPWTRGLRGARHLRWMCQQQIAAIESEKRPLWLPRCIEKAMRWLGFIQGVLCERGIFEIEDLKNHNLHQSEITSGK